MKKFIPKPDIVTKQHLKQIERIFKNYPQIKVAYLYGSQVEQKHLHQESDVDIGVFVDEYDFNLRLELITEVMKIGLNRVDLVMMGIHQITDLLLAFEIVKGNKTIYCKEGFDRVGFHTRIVTRFLDIRPLLEKQFNSLKNKILNE